MTDGGSGLPIRHKEEMERVAKSYKMNQPKPEPIVGVMERCKKAAKQLPNPHLDKMLWLHDEEGVGWLLFWGQRVDRQLIREVFLLFPALLAEIKRLQARDENSVATAQGKDAES